MPRLSGLCRSVGRDLGHDGSFALMSGFFASGPPHRYEAISSGQGWPGELGRLLLKN